MSLQLFIEDCHEIFAASQEAWSRLEAIKNRRLFQLEILYLTLKDNDPTESIMRAIAILDEQEAEQRKKYLALVAAHKAALDSQSQQSSQ